MAATTLPNDQRANVRHAVHTMRQQNADTETIATQLGISKAMVHYYSRNLPLKVALPNNNPPMFPGLTQDDIDHMPPEYILFYRVYWQAMVDAKNGRYRINDPIDDDEDIPIPEDFVEAVCAAYYPWRYEPKPIKNAGWRYRLQNPVRKI